MNLAFDVYSGFNLLEGLLWLAFAIAIPILIDTSTLRRKRAVALASIGFIYFAASDFSEAWIGGEIPVWLWILKVTSGLMILSSRFAYVGWHRWKLNDRYFLFGLFCMIAVVAVILFQHYAQPN